MDSKGFVDLLHEVGWHPSKSPTYALNSNGAYLFGLGLGLDAQSCFARGESDLEGVDLRHIRGDGNNRHDPTAEAIGGGVRPVTADDDRRTALVRLSPNDRVEVH